MGLELVDLYKVLSNPIHSVILFYDKIFCIYSSDLMKEFDACFEPLFSHPVFTYKGLTHRMDRYPLLNLIAVTKQDTAPMNDYCSPQPTKKLDRRVSFLLLSKAVTHEQY